MTAKEQNFTMNAGETKKISVDQTEDEDEGGDLNIEGYRELKWILSRNKGGQTEVEKTVSDSSDFTVTDATVGAYEIIVTPSDTEDLSGYTDEFYHRVRLTDSSGQKSDLLEGTITIEET